MLFLSVLIKFTINRYSRDMNRFICIWKEKLLLISYALFIFFILLTFPINNINAVERTFCTGTTTVTPNTGTNITNFQFTGNNCEINTSYYVVIYYGAFENNYTEFGRNTINRSANTNISTNLNINFNSLQQLAQFPITLNVALIKYTGAFGDLTPQYYDHQIVGTITINSIQPTPTITPTPLPFQPSCYITAPNTADLEPNGTYRFSYTLYPFGLRNPGPTPTPDVWRPVFFNEYTVHLKEQGHVDSSVINTWNVSNLNEGDVLTGGGSLPGARPGQNYEVIVTEKRDSTLNNWICSATFSVVLQTTPLPPDITPTAIINPDVIFSTPTPTPPEQGASFILQTCSTISDSEWEETIGGSTQEPAHNGIQTAIGCIPSSPQGLVTVLFRFFIGIGGGIAFLLILYGAIRMMIARGDPKALEESKEIITSAIVGLLLIILSMFILRVLGVDILAIPGFS